MSNSNGIITAPVSLFDDISVVLGSSSTDLGTLCLSDRINPISKRKPIKSLDIRELVEQDFKNENYGLSVPIFTTDGSLISYIKPINTFRSLDFDGYNHKATAPFTTFIPGKIYATGNVVSLHKEMNINGLRDRSINCEDIMCGGVPLSDMYLCLLKRYHGGANSAMFWITSNTVIGTSIPASNAITDVVISLPTDAFGANVYYDIYLCASKNKNTSLTLNPEWGNLYSLEYNFINSMINISKQINIKADITPGALLIGLQWYKYRPNGIAEGLIFNYGSTSSTQSITYSISIIGDILEDGKHDFGGFDVYKPANATNVTVTKSLYFNIISAGTVRVIVKQQISINDWVEIYQGSLVVTADFG